MAALVNIKDMTLPEIEAFMEKIGEPRYRARQLAEWVFQKGALTFSDMTNLSNDLRSKLANTAMIGRLQIAAKQVSKIDGTTKYLFRLSDGNSIESVFMPYSFGNSVCVSTQVGCRMGCRFCASTIGGHVRNLTAGEIYDQVLTVQRDQGARVRSVVIMGTGEPFDNYDQVIKFMALLNAGYGLNIGYRHITLSTCGVVPGIKRLAGENLPITLSISLHAPNDEMRDQIMPINKKYPLAILIEACREYTLMTKRRITFEYSLIKGFNDSRESARELARLVKGILGHVNLIPVNPVRERNYGKPGREQIEAFARVLREMGIETTLRREMGADIDAACGQLRRKHAVEENGEMLQ